MVESTELLASLPNLLLALVLSVNATIYPYNDTFHTDSSIPTYPCQVDREQMSLIDNER